MPATGAALGGAPGYGGERSASPQVGFSCGQADTSGAATGRRGGRMSSRCPGCSVLSALAHDRREQLRLAAARVQQRLPYPGEELLRLEPARVSGRARC